MKKAIIDVMKETAITFDRQLLDPLLDDTPLLETGLDSLSFAIVVARLEEELGYDPFVLMDEPFYPRTIADFVSIYEKYKPKR